MTCSRLATDDTCSEKIFLAAKSSELVQAAPWYPAGVSWPQG